MKRPGLPHISETLSFKLLKKVLSLIFFTHGIARIYYWSVEDFGDFLNTRGLVLGDLIAWIITIGEILGGTFLMINYKVKYVVLFHFLIIVSGILLVHLKNGWFVVGHGRNGVEYSVLILMVLLFIYSRESGKKKLVKGMEH